MTRVRQLCSRILLALVIALTGTGALATSAEAQFTPIASLCEPDGLQSSGAWYRICMPSLWNGDLVVYAHGYHPLYFPVRISDFMLYLPDGTGIAEMVNGLGYAFATTSYRANGLVVNEAVDDLVELVETFLERYPGTRRVFVVGESQGGLSAVLTMERYPELFDGGVSVCGPIGDFRRQIDYWGDVRTVFDALFPNAIPPTAVEIPESVQDRWFTVYEPYVRARLLQSPQEREALLSATGLPRHADDVTETVEAILHVLWYNVFASNNGREQLGGQPYENIGRVYRGSSDGSSLNRLVERYRADPSAVREMREQYETSGSIQVPLVTVHTLGDPVVPFWHDQLYRQKVAAQGTASLLTSLPVDRYNHCDVNAQEMLTAFGILAFQVRTLELRAALQAE